MKRNRNSFFTNYNAQTQSFIPDGMPMNNQPGPYTQSSMNSNYYSGPALTNSNDIDNRLSKIERQINRLDNRLSKLESSFSIQDTPSENTYNNPIKTFNSKNHLF